MGGEVVLAVDGRFTIPAATIGGTLPSTNQLAYVSVRHTSSHEVDPTTSEECCEYEQYRA